MPITSITVNNFKGVSEKIDFKIRPITLFIGANSSGKSSCIHALASLSQTIKLGDKSRSLVLDDEFAQVHLGRFIEIAHSKSYKNAIELGVEVGDVEIETPDEKISGIASALYTFKSTKRTQEIFVESACLRVGGRTVQITRNKTGQYKLNDSATGKNIDAELTGNFAFMPAYPKAPNKEWLSTYLVVRSIQDVVERSLRNTLYLGPFRRSPARRYPFRGAIPLEVGAQGEEAISLLAGEYTQSRKRPHTQRVGKWLETLGLAKSVAVSRVGSSDLFGVNITLKDDAELPIADLGYGLSQILPVLTQCSFAPAGATLLFEQPELHLHPGAAKKLANIFSDTVKDKNVNIIAETHSKELLTAMFAELKAKRIKLSDLMAYEVSRKDGKSVYKEIVIEQDGDTFETSHPWRLRAGLGQGYRGSLRRPDKSSTGFTMVTKS